jgi:hypothetical protein
MDGWVALRSISDLQLHIFEDTIYTRRVEVKRTQLFRRSPSPSREEDGSLREFVLMGGTCTQIYSEFHLEAKTWFYCVALLQ